MALCSIQERCVHEIKEKFISWGLEIKDIDQMINKLQKEDFINEERFVRAFVKDKFLFNKWGKQKILFSLRHKNITDKYIQKAFDEILGENYVDVVRSELEKKYEKLGKGNSMEIKGKLYRYGASKGYETEILYKVINSIMKE